MIGADALRAMRLNRRRPRCVWITDGPDEKARDWQDHLNQTDQQRHAVIELAETDIPEALDLRCCVGLEVHVAGLRTAHRARRIHDALIEADALRVITSIHSASGVELLTHGV